MLVGIDGTPSGLEALALGSAFAELTGAELVLGGVYGFAGVGLLWPPPEDAERWVRDAQARVHPAIPSRTRTIQSTSPAHGLTTMATLEDARMIVLGSNREGPIGRVLAGSTARRIANGAPCAVAVAPHGWQPKPFEPPLAVGVGLDDSAEARDALALATTFGSPVEVITAVPIPSPSHPMFAATGVDYAEWRRDELEEAERLAEEATAGLDARITVTEGDPVERLADLSRYLDLLVVGSRRYGPLRSALLGSVSARLIERADCPVVIVPRGVHPAPGEAQEDERVAQA